jgi:chromosome segregation ATPase
MPTKPSYSHATLRSKPIMASPRKVGEWKRASYAIVHEAEQLFEQTNELVQAIQQRTSQTEAKVKAAELAVNTALRTRIQETRRLEQRLDEQIARTEADIDNVETARMTLQSTLTATEAQSSTLNACLEQRMNRPNRELVRDRVEERMETECQQLTTTKSSFSKGLAQLRAEHDRLSADMRSMVIDRDDKSRALRLDEVTLEKRLSMLNRANGAMPRKASKPIVKAKETVHPAPKTPREARRGGYTPRAPLRGKETPRIAG